MEQITGFKLAIYRSGDEANNYNIVSDHTLEAMWVLLIFIPYVCTATQLVSNQLVPSGHAWTQNYMG